MTLATPVAGRTTLVELLATQAEALPDRAAYTYLDEPRTFGELWADVGAFARTLVERGLEPADRVVMALPNGHDFFTAFYGSQAGGGSAVPIFPGSTPERVLAVAQLCGARHIVAPSDTPPQVLRQWREQAPELVISTPAEPSPDHVRLPIVAPDDVAFIQYTSGSTGDPKGVQLSHANLLTNVRQMICGMQVTPDDRFVSWLPCYHDLGLIVMTMMPLYEAASLHLLPTSLRDVAPWLETIERHRGTFTASPDFGFRLCLRHAKQPGRRRPDLSSLRVALNAAEPVRRATIDDFHETFGLRDVMVAAYGLAEATVGVSMWTPSTTNRVDERGTVSVGPPFPKVEVEIRDDDDRVLPAGETGHIIVVSPAVTRGYLDNPEATADLVAGDNAIRTGDIGYVDGDGYLYILSRAKDIIIQAGRTIYPQEVEEVVNAVEGVRYAAAIGVDQGRVEGEQVTVVAETRDHADEGSMKACVMAIASAVHDRFGFRPARVHLAAPRTIPLTPNGKLRRGELKHRYIDRSLRAELVYPPP